MVWDAETEREPARLGGSVRNRLTLTQRELAIVTLLGSKLCVAEIAELLRISSHTVANHKRSIYAKFGVGNRSHAVSMAISMGLFDESTVAAQPGGAPARGAAGTAVRPVDAARNPVVGQRDPAGTEWAPAGRRASGPDPSALVVIWGPDGGCVEQVMLTLIHAGLAFVRLHVPRAPAGEHWLGWQRGALTTLLIDPSGEDWDVAAMLGGATVVVHSTPDFRATVDATLHGANAMVFQNDVPFDLRPVLRLVSHGYRIASHSHVDHLSRYAKAHLVESEPKAPVLTGRERDILASIARGHTVRQTARMLGISAKTVENIQGRLFCKLGTHTRSDTLTTAYRLGLLQPAADEPGGQAATG
jgi:DNA-binding CsgD family transcriptional regulator